MAKAKLRARHQCTRLPRRYRDTDAGISFFFGVIYKTKQSSAIGTFRIANRGPRRFPPPAGRSPINPNPR